MVDDEVVDQLFCFVNVCCCFNSSSIFYYMGDLKSKFEVNEFEFVFEEFFYGFFDEDDYVDDFFKMDMLESGCLLV